MSNERQETIADIVAEMRIGDLCAEDTSASRPEYINNFLDSYADRIEAAAKREREAGDKAAQNQSNERGGDVDMVKFTVDIYGADVIVTSGDYDAALKSIRKQALSEYGEDFTNEFPADPKGGFCADCITDDSRLVQIIFVSKREYLMHETLHAALDILRARGVQDDEALCYLHGYIYNKSNRR